MVAPLIPIGARIVASPWGRAGLAGVGGLLSGFLLSGSKKTPTAQTGKIDTTTTTTTSTYAPSYQFDYSKIFQTDSPGATISKKTAQTPSITTTPTVGVTPTLGMEQSEGSNLTTLALIGGVALVAHGYLTKGDK